MPRAFGSWDMQRIARGFAEPTGDEIRDRTARDAGEGIVKSEDVLRVVVVHGERRLAWAHRRNGWRRLVGSIFVPRRQRRDAPARRIERTLDHPCSCGLR